MYKEKKEKELKNVKLERDIYLKVYQIKLNKNMKTLNDVVKYLLEKYRGD
jgi:hypothetical protein